MVKARRWKILVSSNPESYFRFFFKFQALTLNAL